MKITIDHFTTYDYGGPVALEPHTIRLRPRVDGAQRLLAYQLEITPKPLGTAECLDQEGNVVVEAWFGAQLTDSLTVSSRSEVQTLRANPFGWVPPKQPAAYAGAVRAALCPYLAPEVSAPVAAFAEEVAAGAPETLVFLTALNWRLHEAFAYSVREQGPANPPELTLATREGNCRDLAVLFCAACRARGIAARFVSGYSSAPVTDGPPQLHAWAEAYLLNGGWRGYDPSQGLAVADSHIAIAASADATLAAPVTGTYRGSSPARMSFQISIAAG